METNVNDEPVASTSSGGGLSNPVPSTSNGVEPLASSFQDNQDGDARKSFNLRSRSAKPIPPDPTKPQLKLDSDTATIVWTDVEKINLLDSLYKYGVESKRTYSCLPQKTEDQIKSFLRTRQRLARAKKQMRINQATLRKMKRETWGVDQNVVTPLEEWIKYFFEKPDDSKGSLGVSASLMTQLLPTAFLILSLFEAHPDPKDCEGINYREVYEFLYTITKGNPIKMLPKATANFLFTAFYDSSKFYKDAALANESHYLNAITNSLVAETSTEQSDAAVTEKSAKFKTYPGKRKQPPVSEKGETIPEYVTKLSKIHAINPLKIPPKYFEFPRLSSESKKSVSRQIHSAQQRLKNVEKSVTLPFFGE